MSIDFSENILLSSLENYLKREGLREILLDSRRGNNSQTFTVVFVLAGIWFPATYFLWHYGNTNRLLSLIAPVIFFFVFSLVISIFFAIKQFRDGDTQLDASSLGSIYMVGLPVIVGVALGFYLASWKIPLWYFLDYIATIGIALLLEKQAYRLHLLKDFIFSIFKAFFHSVKYLLVLLPILLIIIILSTFSEDMWKAIGTLSYSRLLGTVLLILTPAFILFVSSLEKQTKTLMGKIYSPVDISRKIRTLPFLVEQVNAGLISDDEWGEAKKQFSWKNFVKLDETVHPIIEKKLNRWFKLLIGVTSITLAISFFAYFFVFFNVALDPKIISLWTNTELIPLIGFKSGFGIFSVFSIIFPIIKVSIVLATFMTSTFIVYSLTDETVNDLFTLWLFEKSSVWLAASLLYRSAVEPNYQRWEYIVRDLKKGIANVFIVIPKELPLQQIEDACNHMYSRLDEYRTFIMITAFEENTENPKYRLGKVGNRWRLLHNKANGYKNFETISLKLDELRYRHFFGRERLKENKPISQEWFGNTEQAIKFGEAIWNADLNHEWILHPYIFQGGKTISLEVYLKKRRQTTEQYRKHIQELLEVCSPLFVDDKSITITLYFKDTVDLLAQLDINRDIDYATYKDEFIKNSQFDRVASWGL